MVERRFLAYGESQVGLQKRAEGDDADGLPLIEGYAAKFYDGTPGTEFRLWDGTVERIMSGAFDRAISENDDVRALRDHDTSLLLGRRSVGTLSLAVDDIGLRFVATPPNTQNGRDTVELLKRRDLSGSSFAFNLERDDQNWREEGELDIREILNVSRLWDVGPVTNPAYDGTSAGVRSQSPCDEARASWEAWQAEKTAKADAIAEKHAGYRKRVKELAG